MSTKIPLTHPGIILRDEFFAPMQITQLAAANSRITNACCPITITARL